MYRSGSAFSYKETRIEIFDTVGEEKIVLKTIHQMYSFVRVFVVFVAGMNCRRGHWVWICFCPFCIFMSNEIVMVFILKG